MAKTTALPLLGWASSNVSPARVAHYGLGFHLKSVGKPTYTTVSLTSYHRKK